jgi:hypothetical protein
MGSGQRALSGAAFTTLLLIALMMGANHVALRMDFDHGMDVTTTVAFCSLSTALVESDQVKVYRVQLALSSRHE